MNIFSSSNLTFNTFPVRPRKNINDPTNALKFSGNTDKFSLAKAPPEALIRRLIPLLANPETRKIIGEIKPSNPAFSHLSPEEFQQFTQLLEQAKISMENSTVQRLETLKKELLPIQETIKKNTSRLQGEVKRSYGKYMRLREKEYQKIKNSKIPLSSEIKILKGVTGFETRVTENAIDLNKIKKQALLGTLDFMVPLEFENKKLNIFKSEHPELDLNNPKVQTKLNTDQKTIFLAKHEIPWGREKASRDFWQNFSDAHGKTLEGVRLVITQNNRNKEEPSYTIRIEGQGEYNHQKLEKLGASSKKGVDSKEQIGNHGEGTKVLPLAILNQGFADTIHYSSRDWDYNFFIGPSDRGNSLFRRLTQVQDRPGNFMELTTRDTNFVKAIVDGINYFYHPGNEDFNATYENNAGGFKYLGPTQSGNCYYVTQRVEVRNVDGDPKWSDALDSLTLWSHQKVTEKGRDRPHLEMAEIQSEIMRPILKEMSTDDLLKTLVTLKDHWIEEDALDSFKKQHNYQSLNFAPFSKSGGQCLLHEVVSEIASRKQKVIFPLKYFAEEEKSLSGDLRKELKEKGFLLCPHYFSEIGLEKISDLIELKGSHIPITPSKEEFLQLSILKKAVNLLLSSSFSALNFNELNSHLILFNPLEEVHKNSSNLPFSYQESLNTPSKKSPLRVWVNQSALRESDFPHIVSLYLAELCKKGGELGNPNYGYTLDSILPVILSQLNAEDSNTTVQNQMKDLQNLWTRSIKEERTQAKESDFKVEQALKNEFGPKAIFNTWFEKDEDKKYFYQITEWAKKIEKIAMKDIDKAAKQLDSYCKNLEPHAVLNFAHYLGYSARWNDELLLKVLSVALKFEGTFFKNSILRGAATRILPPRLLGQCQEKLNHYNNSLNYLLSDPQKPKLRLSEIETLKKAE